MSISGIGDSSYVPRYLAEQDDVTESKTVTGVAQQQLANVGLQLRTTAPGVFELVPSATPVSQASSPTSSNVAQPVDLFVYFKTTYETKNPGKTCPSLDAFKEDAPILENLLARWTLDSALCFFDLLCLDIYEDSKRAGADPTDLASFCQLCTRLSVELLKYTEMPINSRLLGVMRGLFQASAKKMPDTVQPKLRFLLKVLMYPDQAVALGASPVAWFGRNAVLQGMYTRREDVIALLDFACGMHPKELPFIRTTQSDAALSKKLCGMEVQLVDEYQRSSGNTQQEAEKNDLYTRICLLKWIIDIRLLQKQIPTQRLWSNIQTIGLFKESPYKSWIEKVMREYLGNNFELRASLTIAKLLQETPVVALNDKYRGMLNLANGCPSQPIKQLEKQIVEKLDSARKKYTDDPEAYAAIFSDMICLYQIIHDVRFIKDVAQDQLQGEHIPESFVERAFLPTINALEVNEAALNAAVPIHLPPQSPPALVETVPPAPKAEAVATAPKVEIKAKLEKVGTREEKGVPPSVAPVRPAPAPARPDFPRKNASGQEVLRLLLNNGFVIRGTRGGHYQMQHVVSNVQTTVPYHESLKRGTLASIRGAFYRGLGFE